MHDANLNAAAAGLLDELLLVPGELGEDPQAAASSATAMIARALTGAVIASGWCQPGNSSGDFAATFAALARALAKGSGRPVTRSRILPAAVSISTRAWLVNQLAPDPAQPTAPQPDLVAVEITMRRATGSRAWAVVAI
jgi:hypothetical protein